MNGEADSRLNQLLAEAGLPSVNAGLVSRFETYLDLILRWNQRINLTAIKDRGEIIRRHFVESIACAQALPEGIATLLDFGSGAGFPGIPISLCRPEIAVTLAESQGKKAAFLQEVVRVLGLSAKIYPGRAEMIRGQFDCVTLRAVDHMKAAVQSASGLVAPSGWLAVMTTGPKLPTLKSVLGVRFQWRNPAQLPLSEDRILALCRRNNP